MCVTYVFGCRPDKQAELEPPPLCKSPFAQALPAESTTLTKKDEAHDKLTVQFNGLLPSPVIL